MRATQEYARRAVALRQVSEKRTYRDLDISPNEKGAEATRVQLSGGVSQRMNSFSFE